MERGELLHTSYDRPRFLAAFYHVVWLRRVFDLSANSSLVSVFKQVVAGPPPSCDHGCYTCDTAPMFHTDHGAVPDCKARVMKWAEYIIFRGKWTGAMPPCIYRCHLITTMPAAHMKIQHAVLFDDSIRRAPFVSDATLVADDLDCVQLLEDGTPVKAQVGAHATNSTTLTVATFMLCQLLQPDDTVSLYMAVRAALMIPGTTVEPVQTIRDVIVSAVFKRAYVTPSTGKPVWLEIFLSWLRKYAGITCMPYRLQNVVTLNSSSVLQCVVDNAVAVHSISDAQCDGRDETADATEYATVSLVGKTIVDCRYTVHMWARLMKLVYPQSCTCYMWHGTPVIRLRRADLARVMRYGAVHLHCMDVIQLRTPVYKIMCQNYAQIHMDGDGAAANLFMRDMLTLLQSKSHGDIVPPHRPSHNYAGLGILHGIFPRMQGAHLLLTMRPYIDEKSLCIKEKQTRHIPQGAFIKRDATHWSHGDGVPLNIAGIKWDARTIHASLIAFMVQHVPHVISVSAVGALHSALRSSDQTSSCHRVVGLLDYLYGVSRDVKRIVRIDGKEYVPIPNRIPNVIPGDCHVVSYVYSLLSSTIISHDLALECFLEIRLASHARGRNAGDFFAPADMRRGGMSALRDMMRVYNKGPAPDTMHPLYTKPACSFLEYMESALFCLEMQTYLQAQTVCTNVIGAQRDRFCMKPVARPAPLTPQTYRGEMAALNIVRYRRDDARDVGTNESAYEIGEGVYQTTALPLVVLACQTPWSSPDNPLYGADPSLIECLFLAPLDHVEIETTKTYFKRKRDAHTVESVVGQPPFKLTDSPLLSVPSYGFDMDYQEFPL